MNRKFLTELAEAAYQARMKLLRTGAYPKAAFQTPRAEYAVPWDELDERDLASAIKDVYRQEAEAVIGAFHLFILMNGTPEAKRAFNVLNHEMKELLFTELELAKAESREA